MANSTYSSIIKGLVLFCFMMEEYVELAKKKQDEKENIKSKSVVLLLGLCLVRVGNVDVEKGRT